MKNLDVLSTLFVGIDVSAASNVVCAMDFHSNKLLEFSVSNNHPGAVKIAERICTLMDGSSFKTVIFALESTSFYSIHIANFLASDQSLMPFNPFVYCLNPKMTANYRKSFIGMDKTDPKDAFLLADFARVGRINTQPWRGSQFLALQRLTRHRLHIVEAMSREKAYMVSNIFLKFSELSVLKDDQHPFTSNYTATAEAVLTEMLTVDELVNIPVEELISFICNASRNRFHDPEKVAAILQKAARDSYRLDKCLYEPLTISIASSFNLISAYQTEIKSIEKAIEKTIRGLNHSEYQCLLSIPGIGPVYASGILAEIGSVSAFRSQDAVAKYAGLVWKQNQSGNFQAEDTSLSKAGNRYLRYYLIEAANSVRHHIPDYNDFYHKKYAEVKTHQHKRALALTSRKLIRLIYGLLDKNQLYSQMRVALTT
jgi:transposase